MKDHTAASGSHLDLSRAPYVLYGVKYIDSVSLARFQDMIPLTLEYCAQLCKDSGHTLAGAELYGVKCIDPVHVVSIRGEMY